MSLKEESRGRDPQGVQGGRLVYRRVPARADLHQPHRLRRHAAARGLPIDAYNHAIDALRYVFTSVAQNPNYKEYHVW